MESCGHSRSEEIRYRFHCKGTMLVLVLPIKVQIQTALSSFRMFAIWWQTWQPKQRALLPFILTWQTYSVILPERVPKRMIFLIWNSDSYLNNRPDISTSTKYSPSSTATPGNVFSSKLHVLKFRSSEVLQTFAEDSFLIISVGKGNWISSQLTTHHRDTADNIPFLKNQSVKFSITD